MEFETLLKAILKGFILPPGLLVCLLFAGIVLQWRRKALGMWLIVLSSLTLYGLSMPLTAHYLTKEVETVPALASGAAEQIDAGAIVVLGAGRRSAAPEYEGADTVSHAGLERLRYGVELHRSLKLPILVTGGSVLTPSTAEAELMADVLRDLFRVEEVWVEPRSLNTFENATLSKALLDEKQVGHIILVTHASHMPRAREAFEMTGLTVTSAPMGYQSGQEPTPVITDFLPNVGALSRSRTSLHELIGRLWYQLRHY